MSVSYEWFITELLGVVEDGLGGLGRVRHGCLEEGAAVRDVADDVELPVPSPPEPDLEVALRVDASDTEARPVAPRHPVRPLLPRRRFPDEAGSLFPRDEAHLARVHLLASSPVLNVETLFELTHSQRKYLDKGDSHQPGQK